MKNWFKHEYGYVNLDAENIYFTNSGNWSETHDLKEKGKQKSNKLKKTGTQFFLFAVGCLACYLIYHSVSNRGLSLLLSLGPLILFYALYKYLRTDLGPKFKLPISKISQIEIEKEQVIIRFVNYKKVKDYEILEKVEFKGLELVKTLQSQLSESL